MGLMPLRAWFQAVRSFILDLIFPKLCLGCRAEGDFLCRDCRGRLLFSAPSCPVCSRRNFDGILCGPCAEKTKLSRFLAPFSYRDPLIRELIQAYKYGGVQELKMLFADEIDAFLNFYAVRPHGPAALAPIPLHRSRQRERGFNQALLIAEELGRRLGLPVIQPLRRRQPTDQQIDMKSYAERKRNVAGAFAVSNVEAVAERTVILVDDVLTSGATMFEAARVLREGGARTVWAIVIAKG